jgi:hypothetical protein
MVHPSPYIKRGARRGEHNTTSRAHPPLDAALLLYTWPPATSTSLSLPRGLMKGCVGGRSHQAACRRVVEFLDPCPTPSTSAILARTGILGVIVIAVHVRVCGGAARATPESLLQDLHDLEVGYFVFIVNACAGV